MGDMTEAEIRLYEKRHEIFEAVEAERAYQDKKWGREFDDKNTPNDWVAYLTRYTGLAVTMPWDEAAFRKAIVKVMAICCAILERDTFAPRHYDR